MDDLGVPHGAPMTPMVPPILGNLQMEIEYGVSMVFPCNFSRRIARAMMAESLGNIFSLNLV